MSAAVSGRALLRRIVGEHTRVLVPLLVALFAGVLVYAFMVRPMANRLANIEESSRVAELDRVAAKREFDQASGTLTAKDRASQELSTFYSTVLPKDLAGARRLTTLRLHQMARQSDLDLGRLAAQDVAGTGSTLTQLKILMDLAGSYANIRRFIHQLEIAPEFVVIDNVTLTEGADEGGTLVVSMELSTYYRDTSSGNSGP